MSAREPSTPAGEAFEAALAALGGADAVSPEARARLRAAMDSVMHATEEKLARAQRLAATGRLLAAAAHELRNPLSVIETSAFVLAEGGDDAARRVRHTRRIAEQVRLANGILGDLLDGVRGRVPAPEPVDLADAVRAALAQLPGSQRRAVSFEHEPGIAPARANARRVQQALRNLIANALEATGGAGPVHVRIALDEHAGMLRVTVRDGGPGIAAAAVDRLFEPLFTTRDEGHGLGLWLSREAARAYGGELEGGNDPGGGARFVLSLPVQPTAEPERGSR